MQRLNLALFDTIAAGFAPNAVLLDAAAATTAVAPWLTVGLILMAVRRHPALRGYLLLTLVVAGITSLLTKEIATVLNVPRPFMAGLSPAYIPHGARGGLPSAHAAVMFSVAFMLLIQGRLRATGWAVAGLAACTAWSRVYLGVHFPLDIAAGALLGGSVAAAMCLILSTIDGHHRPAGESIADAAQRPFARALLHGNTSRYAVMACAAIAVWVGVSTPDVFSAQLVQEGGPVETGTIVLYLLTIACVLAAPRASLTFTDKVALCIVMLAFAGREADLHLALFDFSLLRVRFYTHRASAAQLAVAAAVLVPVVLSACWLMRQYWNGWRAARSRAMQWRTPAITVLAFCFVMLIVNALDQAPATLSALGVLNRLPPTAPRLMVSMEEILEMFLPVLAMLALLQDRLGRTPGAPSAF